MLLKKFLFSYTEKYSKDLCATKKKLADVETKLQAAEKQARTRTAALVHMNVNHLCLYVCLLQAKQLTKDRDIAVSTLAQMKSAGSQKEGLLQTTSEMRQSEAVELRRRFAFHAKSHCGISQDIA